MRSFSAIILIAISIQLFLACKRQGSTEQPLPVIINQNSLMMENLKIYNGDDYGFRVSYPGNWVAIPGLADNIPVMFQSRQPQNDRDMPEAMNVVLEITPFTNVDAYFNENLKVMGENLEEFNLYDQADSLIGDFKLKWLKYGYEIKEIEITNLACFYLYDHRAYVVTCSATKDKFESLEKAFLSLVLSLKIKAFEKLPEPKKRADENG